MRHQRGLSLMGLQGARARMSGRVTFAGETVDIGQMVALRRAGRFPAAMIFQDAVAGLNPIRTVGSQIAEVFVYGRGLRQNEAAGAAPRDVVKLNTYSTHPDYRKILNDTRPEFFAPPYPASTGVVVSALFKPEALFEVKAIAVLDA